MIFNEKLKNIVRKDALVMEERRNVSQEILQYIYEQGLFKLLVPKQFGGRMTSLPDSIKIFEEAAYIDGNFGWLITICSGNAYAAKLMPQDLYSEKFSDQEAAVSLNGFPGGKAKRVDGGYKLSGEWKYCSGSTFVQLFILNGIVESESEADTPEMRTFILEPSQVKVMDDWNALGLKATTSNTVIVDKEVIPVHMTMPFDITASNFDDDLLTFPFFQFAKAQFASMILGMAKHFFEEAKNLAEKYKNDWSKSGKYDFVCEKIQKVEEEYKKERLQFYKTINGTWTHHISGHQFTENEKVDLNTFFEDLAKNILKLVHMIYPFLGINVVLEGTMINKIWRDIHTACQHGVIVAFRD
jgi:indole-3-acetate monooxygenase